MAWGLLSADLAMVFLPLAFDLQSAPRKRDSESSNCMMTEHRNLGPPASVISLVSFVWLCFHITKGSLFKMVAKGASLVAQPVKNPTSIQEDAGSIPDLTPWVNDPAFP